jgi:predicted amidohydrolase YtcJ
MKKVTINNRFFFIIISIFCTGTIYPLTAHSQQLDSRLLHYPETLIVNANVISMDDEGVNENVGSTYQALAIRDGRIFSLGSTADIMKLAGPDTAVYDVNGRTVLPGIIDTHSHPHEYAEEHWGPPVEGDYIVEEEPGDDWPKLAQKVVDLVASIKDKHSPGEWVFIDWPRRIKSTDMMADTALRVHRILTRQMLDQANTEQNILLLGNRGVMNTSAMDIYGEFFGGDEYPDMSSDDGIYLSGSVVRVLRGELTPIPKFKAMMEQEFLEWTAYGITTFGSRIGMYNQTAAIRALDAEGRMPLRYAYALDSYWFRVMPDMPEFRTNLAGTGSDWLWQNSISISSGDGAYPLLATSIEARPEIKEREVLRKRVEYIKDFTSRGLRWANTHIAGDRTLDVALDMIEEGSAVAGMSADEIRAMRHGSDHCRVNPRPDQMPRLKRLGVIMSCAPKYIQGDGPDVAKDYGKEYLSWVVPMRSIIEGGVRAVFEIDSHAVAGEGAFFHIGQYVNRMGNDGNVLAEDQKINRTWALKTATSWASYYVLKENDLGTLEEGKFADLIVLNKNYFDKNLPDDMLKTVRPLMTIIGGHLRYLDNGLAAELKIEPFGIQPEQVIRQIHQWETEGTGG